MAGTQQLWKQCGQFLSALGLQVNDFLHGVEKTRKGLPHVDEVLEKALETCYTAVVLWTGDEIVHLRRQFFKPGDTSVEKGPVKQPRPNVIYELGWAKKFYEERIVLVQIGEARIHSDVGGRYVCKLRSKSGEESFRKDLVDRLSKIGCSIRNTESWKTAGDFGSVIAREEKDRKGQLSA